MTNNLEVYKKAIKFLMNLEEALSEEERVELLNILEEAKKALPPQLLQALESISLEVLQAVTTEEDDEDLTHSYLRDL